LSQKPKKTNQWNTKEFSWVNIIPKNDSFLLTHKIKLRKSCVWFPRSNNRVDSSERIKFLFHGMRKQKQVERCWNDLFQSESIVEMLLTLNSFLSFSTLLFFLFIFIFSLLMFLQIFEAIQKFYSCVSFEAQRNLVKNIIQ
jgi:hypothetical protein